MPFEPDNVQFQLPDVFHSFRRSHHIMVQVQSSWLPLVDCNPQKFMKIDDADPTDFQRAVQRVYRSPKLPSGISLEVLPPAEK